MPFAIAAATGARRSEVLALTWANVHLDGDRPRVLFDGGLHRVGGRFRRLAPKSERSNRVVYIPASLTAILRAHKAEQNERRLLAGAAWRHDEGIGELVADRGDGGPLDPDTVSKAFHRAAERAKVSGVRLHDLRHAWALQIASGGDYATVSQALGHATVGFTLTIYTHPNEDMAAPLANATEATLGGALAGL